MKRYHVSQFRMSFKRDGGLGYRWGVFVVEHEDRPWESGKVCTVNTEKQALAVADALNTGVVAGTHDPADIAALRRIVREATA